jgi:capsule polysaccharide export protein KpsE/RkpR
MFSSKNEKIKQYRNFIYSRRVLDRLDTLYQLQKTYEIEDRQIFYNELRSNIVVKDNDDNTISVDVFLKNNAKRAAEIANSIYDELFKLALNLNRDRNTKMRYFLENSYNKTLERLRDAEKLLTNYQVDNQIYDVESQVKSIIDKITSLELEKIQNEMEMQFLMNNLSNDNEKILAIKTKIYIISLKIDELKFSEQKNQISLRQLPNKAINYMNLYRDVKVLNKVLEFLIPQLENAKLEEIKTTADIQLLDKAVPEDNKAKPKRASVVFTISFLYLIFSILLLIIKEYIKENNKIILNISE